MVVRDKEGGKEREEGWKGMHSGLGDWSSTVKQLQPPAIDRHHLGPPASLLLMNYP